MVERLTRGDGFDRRGHEFRYRLAAGFVGAGGSVLDAACGTGYGRDIVLNAVEEGNYLGVDIDLSALEARDYARRFFVEADLQTWTGKVNPKRSALMNTWDVFISFETIEHLADYSNLIRLAHLARSWIIMSAPIVPTTYANHHHLHDFAPGDLQHLLTNDEWDHYQTVQQPAEAAEIVVMSRR